MRPWVLRQQAFTAVSLVGKVPILADESLAGL
jgi:hypothetical protein